MSKNPKYPTSTLQQVLSGQNVFQSQKFSKNFPKASLAWRQTYQSSFTSAGVCAPGRRMRVMSNLVSSRQQVVDKDLEKKKWTIDRRRPEQQRDCKKKTDLFFEYSHHVFFSNIVTMCMYICWIGYFGFFVFSPTVCLLPRI